MLNIYLDQNKWIDLSKAYHGVPAGRAFEEALDCLTKAVREYRARTPLSVAHYMETWNQRDAARRRRLAQSMFSLAMVPEATGPCTIACPAVMLAMELRTVIAQRQQQDPICYDVFGVGIGHVFGDSSYGRINPTFPEDFPAPLLPLAETLLRDGQRALEATVLSGPVDNFPVAGIDNESYFKLTESHLAFQREVSAIFEKGNVQKEHRRSALASLMIKENLDLVAQVLNETGAPRSVLRLAEEHGGVDLLISLPSQHMILETLARSFDNPQFPRGRGDLNDVFVTVASVPYCDVVVMEKLWGATVKQTGLDQAFGTVVIHDLRQLPELLNQ